MFRCHVCGSTEVREERLSEIFQIDGQPVLVEHIPARVCVRCGEAAFSRETTEAVRRLVHGDTRPVRAVQMNVFEFA